MHLGLAGAAQVDEVVGPDGGLGSDDGVTALQQVAVQCEIDDASDHVIHGAAWQFVLDVLDLLQVDFLAHRKATRLC